MWWHADILRSDEHKCRSASHRQFDPSQSSQLIKQHFISHHLLVCEGLAHRGGFISCLSKASTCICHVGAFRQESHQRAVGSALRVGEERQTAGLTALYLRSPDTGWQWVFFAFVRFLQFFNVFSVLPCRSFWSVFNLASSLTWESRRASLRPFFHFPQVVQKKKKKPTKFPS